jgi:hypothetical protein
MEEGNMQSLGFDIDKVNKTTKSLLDLCGVYSEIIPKCIDIIDIPTATPYPYE